MIKRILMTLSDSETVDAEIQHGVDLARYHGAELTAVTAMDLQARTAVATRPLAALAGNMSRMSASGWARELAAEQAETIREQTAHCLQQLDDVCRKHEVPYFREAIVGDAFDYFVAKSRYYDLFLCGSGHIVENSILDASSDALLRLVSNGVRPIVAVPRDYRPLRRVMIAYTGSVDSAKTMKLFIQSQLLPVLALKIVTFSQSESAAREILADATRYCQAHGYHADVAVLPGLASNELIKHADDWGADLLVLGNSDRSVFSRLFFGDPLKEAIREAQCALFLGQ